MLFWWVCIACAGSLDGRIVFARMAVFIIPSVMGALFCLRVLTPKSIVCCVCSTSFALVRVHSVARFSFVDLLFVFKVCTFVTVRYPHVYYSFFGMHSGHGQCPMGNWLDDKGGEIIAGVYIRRDKHPAGRLFPDQIITWSSIPKGRGKDTYAQYTYTSTAVKRRKFTMIFHWRWLVSDVERVPVLCRHDSL